MLLLFKGCENNGATLTICAVHVTSNTVCFWPSKISQSTWRGRTTEGGWLNPGSLLQNNWRNASFCYLCTGLDCWIAWGIVHTASVWIHNSSSSYRYIQIHTATDTYRKFTSSSIEPPAGSGKLFYFYVHTHTFLFLCIYTHIQKS